MKIKLGQLGKTTPWLEILTDNVGVQTRRKFNSKET